MANPLTSRQRCLPDHMSPAGDKVAFEYKIKVFTSGALAVEGPIEELAYTMAVFENAKDAVKAHHTRKSTLIIPSKDVELPTVATPIKVDG